MPSKIGSSTLADLIIPATLLIWLVFLFVFVLLGYSVPFSILFGAVGGISGGIASAWWQVKGGTPAAAPKKSASSAQKGTTGLDEDEFKSRWDLPFFKNPAKQRYLDRGKRARARRAR